MTIYIANGNGDWWEFDSDSPIFVLDTDQLYHTERDEIESEWGFEEDKFEKVIQAFGNPVMLDELVSNNLMRKR